MHDRMYDHAHEHDPRSRSPEPAGTPAASCCACCSAIPSVEIGALTAGVERGRDRSARSSRTWCRWPTGCSPRPPSRPSPGTTWCSWRCRTASPAALAAAAAATTSSSSTAAPTSGCADAGAVGAVLRRHARRHLALRPARAARASATLLRGAPRIAVPGLLPDRLHAGPRPGRRGRPGRSPTSWSSRPPAPAAPARRAKPHLLGSEVMGNASAYGVGGTHRHTPEIVQNLSALTDGDGAGQLHPAAGADAARHPRHLLRAARPPGVDRRRRARRPT